MDNTNALYRVVTAGGVVLLGFTSGQAFAENPGGWEYSVSPLYLWAKAIDATSTVAGKHTTLDLDFDDILSELDTAFAIHFEAKQGALTLFAEYNYAKLDPTIEQSVGPITIKADIEFKDTLWEIGATYAFAESDTTRWEVLGGIRYRDQELDLGLDTGGIGPGVLPDAISAGDDWWQGFGGFRVSTRLTERWSFRARADLGYEDTNNQMGHVSAMFDYRFRDWGSFFVGYRYMDIDYDNRKSGPDGYGYNGDEQGPLLGMSFYF